MVSTPTYAAGAVVAGAVVGVTLDRLTAGSPSRIASRESSLSRPAGDRSYADLPGAFASRSILFLPPIGVIAGAMAIGASTSMMPTDRIWHRRPTGIAALLLTAGAAGMTIGAAGSRHALG